MEDVSALFPIAMMDILDAYKKKEVSKSYIEMIWIPRARLAKTLFQKGVISKEKYADNLKFTRGV